MKKWRDVTKNVCKKWAMESRPHERPGLNPCSKAKIGEFCLFYQKIISSAKKGSTKSWEYSRRWRATGIAFKSRKVCLCEKWYLVSMRPKNVYQTRKLMVIGQNCPSSPKWLFYQLNGAKIDKKPTLVIFKNDHFVKGSIWPKMWSKTIKLA